MDNNKVAKAVSNQLGLNGYFAEVLPDQKVQIVKDLQSKGEFVAMTRDGVNDIILVNSNPQDIANLILLGKAIYKKMIQNLVWSTGDNVITIPLAAGVLYKSGFDFGLTVGAILMSLSTIVVAINAQLLRRK